MGEISLKINGTLRNVNLSRLEWGEALDLNTMYGEEKSDSDYIFSNIDCIMQSTLNASAVPAGADNKFFLFRSTHCNARLIKGTKYIEDQGASRVVYLGPAQKDGDLMDIFYQSPTEIGIPFPPTNTILDLFDHDQNIYDHVTSTENYFSQNCAWRTGANVSGIKCNLTSAAVIETAQGGRFGVSMCEVPSNGNGVIVWSFGSSKSYDSSGDHSERGNEWTGWSNPITGWYPSFGGVAMLAGTPLGSNCWNAMKASGSYADSIKLIDNTSAEIVYTEIGGKPYLGCAACKWAAGMISEIDVVFLPAWFWGNFETSVDPDEAPQFYGLDGQINGGDGEYTDNNETPPIPSAVQPFSGVSANGYGLHVYQITGSDYEQVQAALWGAGTIAGSLWNRWQNYKFNPIAAIISCHCVPDQLLPSSSTTGQLRAGGACIISSGVTIHNAKTTTDKTFTPLVVKKFFSNHLAYDPFTSIKMFLPFCGFVDIPADRVRGGAIGVSYRCDIITGNCVAFVDCQDQSGAITYQVTASGNCALSFPITGNDNGTGQVLGAISGMTLSTLANAAAGNAAGIALGVAGGASSIAGAQHTTQINGQYSGSVASLGQLSVLAFITQPIQQQTELSRELGGLVSFVDATISDMIGSGFTQCELVKADIAGATDGEKAEIERLLKEGVYL